MTYRVLTGLESCISQPMPASEDWITLRIADTIGGLIEFWGVKRPMGRMWAILYLSEEPMSAAELGGRLPMSSGAGALTRGAPIQGGGVEKTWGPRDAPD